MAARARAAEPTVDTSRWKTEEVDPSELRVGDTFIIYGLELGHVTHVSKEKPEAGLVFEWKGRELTGLRPRKAGEKVTRVLSGV